MRLIVILVLVLGIGLAGSAVYLARDQINQYEIERNKILAAQAELPPVADVVIVKRALKYGERFSAADLEIIKVQADRLPEGAFNKIVADADTPAASNAVFIGGDQRPRAALRSYGVNEPLLASRVTAAGSDAGITAGLSANMRAFTVRVDQTSGVSGFLRPGDRVDVYWSGASGDQQVAKLIESNLPLIAVNQNADPDRTEESVVVQTVTAEISPEQVAALTLAQSTGKLTLSLVGMTNTSEVGPIEIDHNKLLGIAIQEPVAAPAAPKVCTIKTRKGADVIETPIPCTN